MKKIIISLLLLISLTVKAQVTNSSDAQQISQLTVGSLFGGSLNGNGAGVTNLQANALGFTNQTATGSTTNYIIDANGRPNVGINLTADACIVGFTNGPGVVSVTFNCADNANHNVLFPSACHLYGTNVISAIKGTNSLMVATNGLATTIVIKPFQPVANPSATNMQMFLGESAN